MFGIGFEELLIIAVIVLLAVGPDKMPTFVKAVGKGIREFRRATRELKNSVGLDELLRDEDLAELRRPLTAPPVDRRTGKAGRYTLTNADLHRECPPEGVDLAHLDAHPPGPVAERAAGTAAEGDQGGAAGVGARDPEGGSGRAPVAAASSAASDEPDAEGG